VVKAKELGEQRLSRAVELFSMFLESIVLLEGKRGRGKTLALVAMSYQLRELFGRHVITVGSKAGLRPEFGDYTYLDETAFLKELNGIREVSATTPEGAMQEVVEEALRRMGINILGATMIFDEAYKLFDCRSTAEKLVKVFGYFIAQSRHYGTTILLSSPHRDMIDKRVRRQIDWYGRCFYSPHTQICTVRFTSGADSIKMRIYGPNYFDLFDSWVLLGYRKRQLQIGEV